MPTLNLAALMRQLLQQTRDAAAERGDDPVTVPLGALQQAEVTLRDATRPGVDQVEATYRARTEALAAVMQTRRARLEAYAQRLRHRVPPKDDAAILAGRVTDAATGAVLPHVAVHARDANGQDVGATHTDALGYFRLERAEAPDEGPLTVEVLDPDGGVLFTHASAEPARPGTAAFIAAAVDGERVPASRALGQEVARAVTRQKQVLTQRIEALRPVAPARPVPPRPVVPEQARPPALLRPLLAQRRPQALPVMQDAGPDLRAVEGVGKVYGERLRAQGYATAASVAALAPERLAQLIDTSPGHAAKIVEAARRTVLGDEA